VPKIDRLTWEAFRFDEGILRIQATKYFSPKTEDAIGDVPLEAELVQLFRGYSCITLTADPGRLSAWADYYPIKSRPLSSGEHDWRVTIDNHCRKGRSSQSAFSFVSNDRATHND
jgi:hypothetical protein